MPRYRNPNTAVDGVHVRELVDTVHTWHDPIFLPRMAAVPWSSRRLADHSPAGDRTHRTTEEEDPHSVGLVNRRLVREEVVLEESLDTQYSPLRMNCDWDPRMASCYQPRTTENTGM
jgi:hypothetical protein